MSTTLGYATVETYLGWMLLAANDDGICRLSFGDSAGWLRNELAEFRPDCKIKRSNSELSELVAPTLDYLVHPMGTLDLPINCGGTDFQRSVWDELRRIPSGEFVTYSELADQIERPNAVRAVGTACGANPVAIVIPCHRAMRKCGSLAGYRWGLNRKRMLRQHELAFAGNE